METNEHTSAMIGAVIKVDRRLGPDLLESAHRLFHRHQSLHLGIENHVRTIRELIEESARF